MIYPDATITNKKIMKKSKKIFANMTKIKYKVKSGNITDPPAENKFIVLIVGMLITDIKGRIFPL